MLKDFAKLHTFLTVVKEKSFSKASAKLGISQPAVTQQIKFIEDEIAEGKLFESRMRNFRVHRKFYIAYSKDRKHDAFVNNVVEFLLTMRM